MKNKITIEDIRKALDTIKKQSIPLTRIKTIFGYVDIDIAGISHNIGLNEETIKEIKNLLQYQQKVFEDDLMVCTFNGIPIVRCRKNEK